MKGLRKSVAIGVVCAALGAAVAGGTVAFATGAEGGNVYYACSNGSSVRPTTIRVNKLPGICWRSEHIVSWNQEGQPGPQGPQGEAGPPGEPGGDSGLREARISVGKADLRFLSFCDGVTWQHSGCGSSTPRSPEIIVDGSMYPAGATVRLELKVLGSTSSGSEMCARLYNITAGSPVDGSETCAISPTNEGVFRSGPFVLSQSEAVYHLEFRSASGASGGGGDAELIINW